MRIRLTERMSKHGVAAPLHMHNKVGRNERRGEVMAFGQAGFNKRQQNKQTKKTS